MAKRKKQRNIVFIIFLILIGIFILNYIGIFDSFKEVSVLSTVPIEDFPKAAISPYICPSDVSFCKVRGKMECTQLKQGDQKVFFRTDDQDLARGWIAYDNGFAGLSSFTFTQSVPIRGRCVATDSYGCVRYSYTFPPLGEKNFLLSNRFLRDIYINKQTSKIYVSISGQSDSYDTCGACLNRGYIEDTPSIYPSCRTEYVETNRYVPETRCDRLTHAKGTPCVTCTKVSHYEYSLGAGAIINPSPQSNCENLEVCNGTVSGYSCNANFEIKDSSGLSLTTDMNGKLIIRNLSYYSENNQNSNILSDQYDLQPSWKAIISGGDRSEILYGTYRVQDTCTRNTCVGSIGYKTCVNGTLSDNITYCKSELGETCSSSSQGAYCKPKYQLDTFKFVSSLGRDRTTFLTSEVVNIKLKFLSEFSVNTEITIFKGDNPVYTTPKTLLPNTENNIPLVRIEDVGTYDVKVDILEGSNRIPLADGRFSVTATEISSSFDASTKMVDKTKKTGNEYHQSGRFFTNNPIIIEYKTFELVSANNLVSADNYTIGATLNGQTIPLPTSSPGLTQSVGLLKYTIILDHPGTLRFEGRSTRAGRQTDLADINIQVDIPMVEIEYSNAANLISLKPGTTKNIRFNTRSQVGYLIESTNIARVIIPGGTELPIQNIHGSGGSYNFDYTFGEEGDERGFYQFFITSSALNHQTSEDTASNSINVAPENDEVIKDCISDSQCSSGYRCNSVNKCVLIGGGINYILYIVIGIAVALVAIIIILILRRKKKETTFNYGL